MAWIKSNTTKHNGTCTMAFGKPSKHADCPRCEELKKGAEPVKWNTQNASHSLTNYCFSVSAIYDRCTSETNPSCACGKRSYND